MRAGIEVLRNGSKLQVRLAHGLLGNEGFISLEWDAQTELLAAALVEVVRDRLATRIQEVRQQEYERGWKDAKAKRTKRADQSHFFATLFLESA